jgi:chloramphenicol 3-O phosphotransferase
METSAAVLPQILLLNGASSAGKTSLARCLQERFLPELYLNFSIDSILYALPPSVLTRMTTGQDLSDLDYGSLVMGYYAAARALALQGQRLILDDAVTDERLLPVVEGCLRGLEAVVVGVHCDLEELKRREARRGDRTLGEAERQFPVVHRLLRSHLSVDTTRQSPQEVAEGLFGLLRQRCL